MPLAPRQGTAFSRDLKGRNDWCRCFKFRRRELGEKTAVPRYLWKGLPSMDPKCPLTSTCPRDSVLLCHETTFWITSQLPRKVKAEFWLGLGLEA